MIRLWNLVQAQVEVHTFLVGGTLAFDGAKSDVRANCRLIAPAVAVPAGCRDLPPEAGKP